MTLSLELTRDEEAKLLRNAAKAGLPPEEFVKQLIENSTTPTTTSDRIRAVLGNRQAGPGTTAWSEVEAACDPH